MFKRSLALLLSGLMLTGAMAGCGGSKPSEQDTGAAGSDSAQSATDPIKLTIAARGGTHVDVINSVLPAFESENNCKVEVLGLEADDLKQKVALDSKNAKGAYDLCMIDDPVMPEFCDTGVLLDLTAEGHKEDADFVKASLDIGKYPYAEGDVYALPFAGNVTLLFYNQDVLDSVGAKAPDNWTDVLNIAKQVNGKDGKVGYVIRGQQGNPIVGDYMPILWAYGGDIFDKDWNVTVDSAEAKAALQMYMDLLANGANYEKNDIVSAVSDGKAAMSLGWPSWYISGGAATASYARIPGKVDASSTDQPSGVIGNWMMGVTANTQNKDLAIKLLEYLTSAETQKSAADVGAVPTRTSVFQDTELSAKYPFYATLLDATENSRVRPRTPLWSQIEEAYGIELSNAIAGQKDIDTALADAKAQIEKIVK